MALPNMVAGGNFKLPAAGQTFNHDHARQMASAAHRKLAVAKALSSFGQKGMPMPSPKAPGPNANFKATIAHGMAHQGIPVTMNHVHNAIDSLTAKGAFTPFQNQALKQHNGPLEGPQGVKTMGMIGQELATNPLTRRGM